MAKNKTVTYLTIAAAVYAGFYLLKNKGLSGIGASPKIKYNFLAVQWDETGNQIIDKKNFSTTATNIQTAYNRTRKKFGPAYLIELQNSQVINKTINKINSGEFEDFILDAINSDYHNIKLNTHAQKLQFLANTFKNENDAWEIEKYGLKNSFKQWVKLGPVVLQIPHWKNDIIREAKEFKALPAKTNLKQEEKFLKSYYDLVTDNIFKLFDQYKTKI